MYKLHTEPTQTRTTQLPYNFRKTNKRVSFSTSQGKKQDVEDHHRNVKFSKNKTSVTACNDSLNAKTSNVNFVCATCGKCVLNVKHDMCVLHSLNGVNSMTKMPMVVPISTREPKHIVNQSVAKPLRRIVASESTNQKPRHTTRKLYEHFSMACSWWYLKFTPPEYKWKPKSQIGNENQNLVEIILFIVDSGCSKHMTGNLKLLTNFVEKFLDLEVAFQKSTCYIRDLKGNDLLTGSRGTDLYSITLQDTSSPNPICLMAKATSSQAWLWHSRLSHLNFDTINLISKNDIMIGLPKSKDETHKALIDFLRLVQRGLHAQVRIVRTDKGTKFLNKTLYAYFASEGIYHQTSVARTPEQNGVVERRNRTLVKAARIMLSAAKVPLFFWAEAIATACFTQNSSLVIPQPEKHLTTSSMTENHHVSSNPGPQCQENVPHAAGTVTTSNELDLLFSPMFKELLNGSTQIVSKSSVVTTADAPNKCQQQHTTPLNSQTTPDPTCQVPIQAPTVTSTENINQAKTITEDAQVEDDEFIFCAPVQDRGETSSCHVDSSNRHTFYQRHPFEHRWTKDHPLEQVIGNPSQSV
nr:hypothetical protein [Tanacetum cinerariifolium]